MSRIKSSYLIAASVVIISTIVTVYFALNMSHQSQRDTIIAQVKMIRDAHFKEQMSRPYGKIEIPAGIYIGLSPSANPRKEVEIVVSAVTSVLARSAKLVMIIPEDGSVPERQEVLWSGKPDGLVDKTLFYNAGILPVGRHQFAAALEFETDGDNSTPLVAANALFLDVRPSGVLSSNVSFEQIDREELYKELEKQVLVSMRPQLMNADARRLSQEKTAVESTDPGVIDMEIHELIASDPDIARRVEELNTLTANIEQPSHSIALSSQIKPDTNHIPAHVDYYTPIRDEQVPIPTELRN